ncbi:MAG: zf-HC2 domain-containing protein [Polyangiaceae bacterium]|nr:zf-HC2 domain-containing protein [Polyangiaceae bacterium]
MTSDACPSDDLVARFAHGLLSREQAAAIEAHIDTCRDCSALVVMLGKLGATDVMAAFPRTDETERDRARQAFGDAPAASVAGPASGLPAPGSAHTTRPRAQGVSVLALVVAAELTLALVHGVWSAMALPAPGQLGLLRAAAGSGSLEAVALFAVSVYVVIWAPIGGLCALAVAWGLKRRRTWGRRLAWVHAALSLPCPVLLPLAAYVLYAMTRPAVRACWVPQGTR